MNLIEATLILWLFFISVTRITEKGDTWETLSLFEKIYVGSFLVADVLYNFTFGAILFLEPASMDRKTLTARLKHILHSVGYKGTWRHKLASFMCKYMIEPWDFNHCGLSK